MKFLEVKLRIPIREMDKDITEELLAEGVQLKVGGIHDNTVLDINTNVLVDSLATISNVEMIEVKG